MRGEIDAKEYNQANCKVGPGEPKHHNADGSGCSREKGDRFTSIARTRSIEVATGRQLN